MSLTSRVQRHNMSVDRLSILKGISVAKIRGCSCVFRLCILRSKNGVAFGKEALLHYPCATETFCVFNTVTA